MVSISQEELACNGYTEIASQNENGEVVLRNENGDLELFAVRESYAGWSIGTECGQYLDFCSSIT